MKTTRWTKSEEKKLRRRVGRASAAEIGAAMDRSKNAILSKIRLLRLEGMKRGGRTPWTAARMEALKAEGPRGTAARFAAAHGLPLHSVRYWARKFEVRFSNTRLPWTEAELNKLRGSRTVEEALAATGRSRDAVLHKATEEGVFLAGQRGPRTAAKQTAVKPQEPKKIEPVKRTAARRQRTAVECKAPTVGKAKAPEPLRVDYCTHCRCPVSNWEQHWERIAACRGAWLRQWEQKGGNRQQALGNRGTDQTMA